MCSTLLKISLPALTLGVNTNLKDFNPKIVAYPVGLDACLVPKGDIFLNARVNDGSLSHVCQNEIMFFKLPKG